MSELFLIILLNLSMSLTALIGAGTLLLSEKRFNAIVMPLVALSAGSLLGAAFFHLLPEAGEEIGVGPIFYLAIVLGFILFFVLEQFLHWHHCHRSTLHHEPVGYLLLFADTLHNLICGLAIGAAFVVNPGLGIITWAVTALHEIPQELGDFGVLVHSGWSKKGALLFNTLSTLTFPIGGALAYFLSESINVAWLLPFAAGGFLYIAASDLLPQLKADRLKDQIVQLALLLLGISVLFLAEFFH